MSPLRVETCAEGIRTIAIDREEKRNALDGRTLEELEAAFAAAGADPATRAIVLRGAGERAFSAGADLAELLEHETVDARRRYFDGVARVIGAMQRAGPPVIARVSGYALAGGFGLAVAADFTIAAQTARFGLPEIGVGLLPLVVSAPIYRALGSRKALLDLVLTGRQIDAEEARELGLVTRVVADADLDAEVLALAQRLAELSPTTLRLGREAVYALCEMEYGTAMNYLREMITLTSMTEDAGEGIRAFLEKRKPKWTGR
ncbi:MAG: enoyl-CoA hydratase-related protein [Myxococcota bacterium]